MKNCRLATCSEFKMGSFCYTCALSELPIQSGAAVWLVPLCQRGGGLNDGAWGAYKMAFPPIRAEYDEYGGVENPKITALHEACAARLGYASAEEFIEAVTSGAATLDKKKPGEERSKKEIASSLWEEQFDVSFCLVRVDAWSAMLSQPRDSGETPAHILAARAAREGACELAKTPVRYSEMELDFEDGKEEVWAVEELARDALKRSEKDGSFQELHGRDFRRGALEGSGLFSGVDLLTAFIRDLAFGEDAETNIAEGLQIVGEAKLISFAMGAVRKMWAPRNSSGPQCGEAALHWLWADKLLSMAREDLSLDSEYDIGIAEARARIESKELGEACGNPPTAQEGAGAPRI